LLPPLLFSVAARRTRRADQRAPQRRCGLRAETRRRRNRLAGAEIGYRRKSVGSAT